MASTSGQADAPEAGHGEHCITATEDEFEAHPAFEIATAFVDALFRAEPGLPEFQNFITDFFEYVKVKIGRSPLECDTCEKLWKLALLNVAWKEFLARGGFETLIQYSVPALRLASWWYQEVLRVMEAAKKRVEDDAAAAAAMPEGASGADFRAEALYSDADVQTLTELQVFVPTEPFLDPDQFANRVEPVSPEEKASRGFGSPVHTTLEALNNSPQPASPSPINVVGASPSPPPVERLHPGLPVNIIDAPLPPPTAPPLASDLLDLPLESQPHIFSPLSTPPEPVGPPVQPSPQNDPLSLMEFPFPSLPSGDPLDLPPESSPWIDLPPFPPIDLLNQAPSLPSTNSMDLPSPLHPTDPLDAPPSLPSIGTIDLPPPIHPVDALTTPPSIDLMDLPPPLPPINPVDSPPTLPRIYSMDLTWPSLPVTPIYSPPFLPDIDLLDLPPPPPSIDLPPLPPPAPMDQPHLAHPPLLNPPLASVPISPSPQPMRYPERLQQPSNSMQAAYDGLICNFQGRRMILTELQPGVTRGPIFSIQESGPSIRMTGSIQDIARRLQILVGQPKYILMNIEQPRHATDTDWMTSQVVRLGWGRPDQRYFKGPIDRERPIYIAINEPPLLPGPETVEQLMSLQAQSVQHHGASMSEIGTSHPSARDPTVASSSNVQDQGPCVQQRGQSLMPSQGSPRLTSRPPSTDQGMSMSRLVTPLFGIKLL